ncbi:hypothetical protein DRJ17_06385 [Candidatus Woesearchaeota archaeon]|nr:MAG: hypothetical protein DRJ17_06385 [Candidatus Woesearchaeota archaeon]
MKHIQINKTTDIFIYKNRVKYKKRVQYSRKNGWIWIRFEINKNGKISFGITMWYRGKWYIVDVLKNGKVVIR